MKIETLLAIGSGGFIGAILRAYISGYMNTTFSHNIPIGTLFVNLIGSFILGVLFAYFNYTSFFSPTMKSLLSTGMMGALTTYSTFAFESFLLLNGGLYIMALSNMMLNLFGTIFMAGAGYKIVESFLR